MELFWIFFGVALIVTAVNLPEILRCRHSDYDEDE